MMIRKTLFITVFFSLFLLTNTLFGQSKIYELDDFVQPVENWVKADKVQMDVLTPEKLTFKTGGDCIVNGVEGKAKYLVSKKEYQDLEIQMEFMLPKGSNSGIYFQCRYELQLFDSWGVKDKELTFYDCAGIQQRWGENKEEERIGIEGYAPKTNASKAPGEWQSLQVVFRAPTFNSKGEKIKNAQFKKVILNGVLVHENVNVSGPTKGALSETEVANAPFRLQGGHGPVAFRNIKIKENN